RAIAPFKDGQVVFTTKNGVVYAIYLTQNESEGPPEHIALSALKPAPGSDVRMLGFDGPLHWETDTNGNAVLDIPASARTSPPCRHAFVFKWIKN
ncbi:MAG: hypothetical protein M1608_08700, partial [Candidatus Omnitrophica bacterium]|nr:hypothetical protein [Candidatus Omnitrophota bacterium]